MRARRVLPALAAVLTMIVVVGAMSAPALARKPWEKFKYPELGDIRIPDYERHVLDNGMTVYLLEDHTWPLVEGQVIVRTGAAFEPEAKVGLASVTGDVLRTGGTTNIPADELDEKLERMGAYIESGIDDTSGSLGFSFMSKDTQEGLGLVADVLRNPAFDEEKIEVALTGERAGVARRNDNLNGIVAREIQKAVWGADHPYARNTEYASLDRITRDDLVDFYEYFYHPNNVMIAVWGDFQVDEMLALVRERFGDWKRIQNPIPAFPDTPQPQARRVLVANKDDVNQARFAVGQVGMRADDPDYYAMSVLNRILGGGFGDRLFNQVRSNLGLAYNVGSSAGISFSRPGTFQAYCGTKSESCEKALGAVLAEIDKIRAEPVTDQELEDAKEAILNSNVFNYVTPNQVLTRKMNLEYLGYPEDFLETYNEKVRSVDQTAVQGVAQRRLDPDSFAIVAVGKTADWDGDLTSFGPVEKLDIEIPAPEGEQFPEPTAETIERGRAILAAAQGAMGGSILEGLKTLRRTQSVSLSMGGGSMAIGVVSTAVYPDREHVALSMMGMEMLQVASPDACWAKGPQGIQEIGGEKAEKARRQILMEPLYLLGHYDQFPVQVLEPEEVEGSTADVVLCWINDDDWIKLYFDPSSRMLVKTESMGDHPMTETPGLQETFFSEPRKVGGVTVPHRTKTLHGGEPLMESQLTKLEINPKVDESIFAKPAS